MQDSMLPVAGVDAAARCQSDSSGTGSDKTVVVAQVFVEAKAGSEGDDLERELFILRKLIEKEKTQRMGEAAADFYVASLSDKTIVYKVSS